MYRSASHGRLCFSLSGIVGSGSGGAGDRAVRSQGPQSPGRAGGSLPDAVPTDGAGGLLRRGPGQQPQAGGLPGRRVREAH